MGELASQLGRAHVMLAHVQEAVSIVDRAGRVVESTGRLRRSLGHPLSFWEDRTIMDLVVPEDAARALRFRDSVLAAPGVPLTDDFVVIDATGGTQSVSVRAVNLFHDLDVGGIVLSVRNNTRQQALLDELRAARFRATEQLDALRAELNRLMAERAAAGHHVAPRAPTAPALAVGPVAHGCDGAQIARLQRDGAVVITDVLDEMAVDVGDRQLVCDVVAAFLAELDDRLAAIFDAAHDADLIALEDLVDMLSSSSQVVGAHALSDASADYAAGTCTIGELADVARSTAAALRRWTVE